MFDHLVRCNNKLYLKPDAAPIHHQANPAFVEMICAVHELQFGSAQLEYFRAALEAYVYVESCRDCILETLHRNRWVNVAYPVGCSRVHDGADWIDGENEQLPLVFTPEQLDRYAPNAGDLCPPWIRNGGRGVANVCRRLFVS